MAGQESQKGREAGEQSSAEPDHDEEAGETTPMITKTDTSTARARRTSQNTTQANEGTVVSTEPEHDDESFRGYRWAAIRGDCWRNKWFYLIVCLVGFVQGGTNMSALTTSYFFKDDLHLQPATVSLASSIILFPWVVKPLYGFISDSFPIFQLRRKPYLFIFGLTGFISWTIMAYVVTSVKKIVFAVVVLFCTSISLAFVNVLAEAMIVEKGRASVTAGRAPDVEATKAKISFLMTVFWGCESITRIITGYSSGYLLERISKQEIYAITSYFPLTLCILSFLLVEAKSKHQDTLMEQWSVLMGHLRKPQIWKPAVFMFVMQATPSSQTAYFYFLTNDIGFKPEFMGRLSVVAGCSSLLGLTFYHAFLHNARYRSILHWTIFLSTIAGLTPLILILHWNRNWGIPDAWFCIGDTALMSGIGQVALMPLLILGAQTCPEAVEGTLYALLMSTLNVGAVVSDALGGVLTLLVGVKEHNFDRLWLLVVLCGILNMIPLTLLWWIPTEEELHAAAAAGLFDKTKTQSAVAAEAAEAAAVAQTAEGQMKPRATAAVV